MLLLKEYRNSPILFPNFSSHNVGNQSVKFDKLLTAGSFQRSDLHRRDTTCCSENNPIIPGYPKPTINQSLLVVVAKTIPEF